MQRSYVIVGSFAFGREGGREIFPVESDDDEAVEDGTTVRTLPGGGHSGGLHSKMTGIAHSIHSGGKGSIDRHSWDLVQIVNPPHGYNNGFVKPLPSLGSDSGSQYNELLVMPVLTPTRMEKRQHGRRFKEGGEEMFTLTGQDIHGIAYPEIANTVCDGWLMDTKHHDKPMNQYRIRRLTPCECERLQGFPDNWTQRGLEKDGKEVEVSDSQRYRALGNAVTVNMIQFLGGLLQKAE